MVGGLETAVRERGRAKREQRFLGWADAVFQRDEMWAFVEGKKGMSARGEHLLQGIVCFPGDDRKRKLNLLLPSSPQGRFRRGGSAQGRGRPPHPPTLKIFLD